MKKNIVHKIWCGRMGFQEDVCHQKNEVVGEVCRVEEAQKKIFRARTIRRFKPQ